MNSQSDESRTLLTNSQGLEDSPRRRRATRDVVRIVAVDLETAGMRSSPPSCDFHATPSKSVKKSHLLRSIVVACEVSLFFLRLGDWVPAGFCHLPNG